MKLRHETFDIKQLPQARLRNSLLAMAASSAAATSSVAEEIHTQPPSPP